jgi:hypothetical protein
LKHLLLFNEKALFRSGERPLLLALFKLKLEHQHMKPLAQAS